MNRIIWIKKLDDNLNQVIGTHGQVQGRQIVGVVPVGVNLRAEPLRGALLLRGILGVVPVGVNLRALPLRGVLILHYKLKL